MFSLVGPQADEVVEKLQAGAVVGAPYGSHTLLSFQGEGQGVGLGSGRGRRGSRSLHRTSSQRVAPPHPCGVGAHWCRHHARRACPRDAPPTPTPTHHSSHKHALHTTSYTSPSPPPPPPHTHTHTPPCLSALCRQARDCGGRRRPARPWLHLHRRRVGGGRRVEGADGPGEAPRQAAGGLQGSRPALEEHLAACPACLPACLTGGPCRGATAPFRPPHRLPPRGPCRRRVLSLPGPMCGRWRAWWRGAPPWAQSLQRSTPLWRPASTTPCPCRRAATLARRRLPRSEIASEQVFRNNFDDRKIKCFYHLPGSGARAAGRAAGLPRRRGAGSTAGAGGVQAARLEPAGCRQHGWSQRGAGLGGTVHACNARRPLPTHAEPGRGAIAPPQTVQPPLHPRAAAPLGLPCRRRRRFTT